MNTKQLAKFSVGMFALGKVLKSTSRTDNEPLFKNHKYNSPFRLPTMSHPAFGNVFITTKSNRNNDKAEEKAEEICDCVNSMENVELIPVYAKEGNNTIKIKLKPMNNVKKSFNLQRQIKYATRNEETRIYPEGDKIVVEIPHKGATVRIGDFIKDTDYRMNNSKTLVPIGKDVEGKNVYGDLAKMPHMLVAGTTGSGKSVFVNGIITSLLTRNTPYDLQMILIDPKMVEFRQYAELDYVKYVTDSNKAISILSKLCDEMDRRYRVMANEGCRELEAYNHKCPTKRMSRIVLVIDEMADMMIDKKYGKEVEKNIIRIAQKARACGIHMILATQRPSRQVVTGLIKANIPCRVCLSVLSRTDSMVVLDQVGAEKLQGHGDMLYMDGMSNKEPIRLQAGLVTTEEINQLVIPLALDNQPSYGDKFDWNRISDDIREYYGR